MSWRRVKGGPLERFLLPERVERIDEVISRRFRNLSVVLETVHDSHNQAAVIRTAEAFGLLEVNVIESERAGFKPHRKVTRDAHKWMDVHRWKSVEECIAHLRNRGMRIYCGALQPDAVSLYDLNVLEPCAFVFGNEHEGLSAEMLAQADSVFTIPMRGFSESLNISVAAGVVLSHVAHQRELAGIHTDLSKEESDSLRERYIRRSIKFLHRLKDEEKASGDVDRRDEAAKKAGETLDPDDGPHKSGN